jgi:hypothetical protein
MKKCVYCKQCRFNIPTYTGYGMYQKAQCGYQEWNEFTGQPSFKCTFEENVNGRCPYYQAEIKSPSIIDEIVKMFKEKKSCKK